MWGLYHFGTSEAGNIFPELLNNCKLSSTIKKHQFIEFIHFVLAASCHVWALLNWNVARPCQWPSVSQKSMVAAWVMDLDHRPINPKQLGLVQESSEHDLKNDDYTGVADLYYIFFLKKLDTKDGTCTSKYCLLLLWPFATH